MRLIPVPCKSQCSGKEGQRGSRAFLRVAAKCLDVFSSSNVVMKDWDMNLHSGTHK
jgi:hypothetical protein